MAKKKIDIKIKFASNYTHEDFTGLLEEAGVDFDTIEIEDIYYPNSKMREGFILDDYVFYWHRELWQCLEFPKGSWTDKELQKKHKEFEESRGQCVINKVNWSHPDAKKSKKYFTRYKSKTGGIPGFNPTTKTFRGAGKPMEDKSDTKKRLKLD